MPAKNGVPADVPPVGTIGPSFHHQVRVVPSGRGEGNVRNVARIIIRQPRPRLPCGPGKDTTDPAAAGVQEGARSCVVPAHLRNVGQRGSEILLVRGGPVFAGAFGEGGAAHARYLGHAGRRIDRDTTDTYLIPELIFTCGRTSVTTRGDPGDPLCYGLLRDIAIPAPIASRLDLTNAPTKAE